MFMDFLLLCICSGSRTEVWTPDRFGMPSYEALDLITEDQIKLKAYLITQGSETASRPTLLFLHANAGNMGHRLPLVKVFVKQLKMNCLIISYRGCGFNLPKSEY